jgi:hypothetical protein
MAHKQALFCSEAREKIFRVATALVDTIRITLGPKSRSAPIKQKWRKPLCAMMASRSRRNSSSKIRAVAIQATRRSPGRSRNSANQNAGEEQKLTAKCEHCGNDYDKTLDIRLKDPTHISTASNVRSTCPLPNTIIAIAKSLGMASKQWIAKYLAARCARESGKSQLCNRV